MNGKQCCVQILGKRTYCGRKPKPGQQTVNWDEVTCRDCLAARGADQRGAEQ